MSFAALAWASKMRVDRATDKLVLLAFADRHNEESGCAYPSIAWLCDFGSLNRKTVIASIGRLEKAGLLTDSGQRAGDTKQIKVYRLNLETVPKLEQSQNRNSTDFSAKQSQKRDTDTVMEPNTSGDKSPSVARAKPAPRKTRLPDDWEPKPLTPGSVAAATVALWPPGQWDRELSKFRDNHTAKGTVMADWDAAWRTWIGNVEKFGNRSGYRQASGTGPGRTIDAANRAIASLERRGVP